MHRFVSKDLETFSGDLDVEKKFLNKMADALTKEKTFKAEILYISYDMTIFLKSFFLHSYNLFYS